MADVRVLDGSLLKAHGQPHPGPVLRTLYLQFFPGSISSGMGDEEGGFSDPPPPGVGAERFIGPEAMGNAGK